jgi:hypothetical protein
MFTIAPKLHLEFNEQEIPYNLFKEKQNNEYPISSFYKTLWDKRIKGDASFKDINGRERDKPSTGFGTNFLYNNVSTYCWYFFPSPISIVMILCRLK